MTTDNLIAMNINEEPKWVSIFILPNDWHARGDFEFDELVSVALYHPAVAAEEIRVRFKYWQNGYRRARKGKAIATVILLSLFALCYAGWSRTLLECVCFFFMVLTAIGLHRISKRARIIDSRICGCYCWIMNEIISPDRSTPLAHDKIEGAFIRNWNELERRERKAERKFGRLITSFGYTPETIQQ